MGRSLSSAPLVTTATLLLLLAGTGGAEGPGGVQVDEAAAAQGCGRACRTFDVRMIFTQERDWTHHTEQVSDMCVRTVDGYGLDEVRMTGKGRLIFPRTGKPKAFLSGAVGIEERSGVETTSAVGASCASYESAPTTGCGRKEIVNFPSLKLAANTLRVHWTSSGKIPEFRPCPFYDGASDASEGNMLPKGDLFDVRTKVTLKALRNATVGRGFVAGGITKLAATETCANLQQGCAEGVSYNATGSVESTVGIIVLRKRP